MPATPDVTPAGPLIEASFALWLRSWKATLGAGLAYGIASLLPALALKDAMRSMLLGTVAILASDLMPVSLPFPLPSTDPGTVLDDVLAHLAAPQPWLLLALALLAMVAAATLLMVRQQRVLLGADAGGTQALRLALRRTPATVGAWLIYTLALLGLALPFLAVTLGAMLLGLGASPALLLVALAIVLFGGLLASVPLAWASVALGFAPLVTALEAEGALRAQMRSLRLVRGHWWRSAVVVSTPLLIYVGASGMLSSLLLMLCGGIVVLRDGWIGLLTPDWLLWAQALALLPQAALLPLASSGAVVMFEDLRRT